MSNSPKNVTPAEIKAMADEKASSKKATVPAQAKQLEEVQVDAVAALEESLRAVEKNMSHVYGVGVDVRIVRNDEGEFTVQVVDPDETKIKRFAGKAKGVFQRNKKLVIASAGLVATSVLLKALKSRYPLEADEVVESSDDISTEA